MKWKIFLPILIIVVAIQATVNFRLNCWWLALLTLPVYVFSITGLYGFIISLIDYKKYIKEIEKISSELEQLNKVMMAKRFERYVHHDWKN